MCYPQLAVGSEGKTMSHRNTLHVALLVVVAVLFAACDGNEAGAGSSSGGSAGAAAGGATGGTAGNGVSGGSPSAVTLSCGSLGKAGTVHWVSPTGTAAWNACVGTTPLGGTAACSLAAANT